MNKNEEHAARTRYQQDLEEEKSRHIDDSKNYVEENGKRFRIPYRIIKEAVISGINKDDLIDPGHAARLQYRLLLMDAVIKAYVEFAGEKIIIIYNPIGADNIREKTSLEKLVLYLEKEGIHVDKKNIEERDYDYYKEFYSYAFNPKSIREHPPYGYTPEQWKTLKPAWEKKVIEFEKEKLARFREYQKEYEELHPELKRK